MSSQIGVGADGLLHLALCDLSAIRCVNESPFWLFWFWLLRALLALVFSTAMLRQDALAVAMGHIWTLYRLILLAFCHSLEVTDAHFSLDEYFHAACATSGTDFSGLRDSPSPHSATIVTRKS